MFVAVRLTNAMGYEGWMVRDVTATPPDGTSWTAACVAGTFTTSRVHAQTVAQQMNGGR